MKRILESYLRDWKSRSNRKPLVVRGARQVGKTYLIRSFGSENFDNIVELNFDLYPHLGTLFNSRDVKTIIQLLEVEFDADIEFGKTLLFLDEIQAAPEILPLLRYFYEKVPELHIIATGSLLDFVLKKHSFSMPVGRIEYMFMGPLTFSEFLQATGKQRLLSFMRKYNFDNEFPVSIHNKLLELLKIYFVTGGMPAAVNEYIKASSFRTVTMEQVSILQTYRDDFNKYGEKLDLELQNLVFSQLGTNVIKKVKYTNFDRNNKAAKISQCLSMFERARIINSVHHSSGNGIPLGSEINSKVQKLLFLDVGLLSSLLGLKLTDLQNVEELNLINSGVNAEQFIGQHLLYSEEPFREPMLYYWNREKKSSTAEVDYLYEHGQKVIPVEVKAGKTGSLKSLQLFAAEKLSKVAVRFNSDLPSICEVNASQSEFTLISLPLYMVEEMDRLLTGQSKL